MKISPNRRILSISGVIAAMIIIYFSLLYSPDWIEEVRGTIGSVETTSLTLSWSPNTEPYLSHYVMYRDTIPGTMKYLDEIPKTDTTYVDMNVVSGQTYYYKLTAVDSAGNESDPSIEVIGTAGTTTKLNENQNNFISNFELKQNYPNPFNSSTIIEYNIPTRSRVEITIYDVLGKEIRNLVDEYKEVGNYKTIWDGRNNNGVLVSSGIYFYRMTAENFTQVKKLILEK